MKRIHQVVKISSQYLDEYKRLHASIWPEVAATIKECNIQNYSIAFRDGLLFAYFEYTGADYDADMAKMAADPATQKWWSVCRAGLTPVESEKESDCWADLEEVFYLK